MTRLNAASDAPLSLPRAHARARVLNAAEVRRQLHLSLWLVGLLGFGTLAVIAAKPASGDATRVAMATVSTR